LRDLLIGFYFFLLFYLVFYGLHIYWLVGLFLRHRSDNRQPPILGHVYPKVTIQLPIYNERAVVGRLIKTVAALDWPREKLEIQVLDDSSDDTTSLAAAEVNRLRSQGCDVHHIRRAERIGYKAGALEHGLKTASGAFMAVFDADNLPRPDFLIKMMGHFNDPKIGMVQARWSFLNREESLLCRAQALFLDAHFYVEQAARCRGRLFMNFNGTAGIWRRQAIESAGGWQADTLTEDLDLSYRAQMAGWRMVLAEEVDVPTELPSSIRAFKTQQFRWAKGAFESGIKLLPELLRSAIPVRLKLAAFFHLTQKTVSVALLLLSVMLVPALYLRLEGGMWKVLALDLPIFIAGTGSMSLFYGLAYKRERKNRSWRSSLLLPLLTSLGVGLAVNNSLAILSAVIGRHNQFVRTPKAGSVNRDRSTPPSDYRISFDHTIRVELLLALYAVCAVWCAVSLGLYQTLPFLMTFTFGYVYFTVQSIREWYA